MVKPVVSHRFGLRDLLNVQSRSNEPLNNRNLSEGGGKRYCHTCITPPHNNNFFFAQRFYSIFCIVPLPRIPAQTSSRHSSHSQSSSMVSRTIVVAACAAAVLALVAIVSFSQGNTTELRSRLHVIHSLVFVLASLFDPFEKSARAS